MASKFWDVLSMRSVLPLILHCISRLCAPHDLYDMQHAADVTVILREDELD